MPLDPEVAEFLAECARSAASDPRDVGLAVARQQMVDGAANLGPFPPLASVENRSIPGPGGPIPLRIYRPLQAHGGLVVYFHGGGWVLGNLDTHDGYCRSLAAASGATIVSVDYRLAPEHPFPAAFLDSYAATQFAARAAASLGCDPARLAVAGDSAGGNLAAAVALAARDQGGPKIAFQYLIYPVTDAACDTPSYEENAEGYYLTRDSMLWFWQQYLPHPRFALVAMASPLRAASHASLPPAFITTAEFDPLRDEGEAYAQKLKAAGVPVEHVRYPGLIHGYARRTKVFSRSRQALEEAGAALRRAIGGPGS